MTPEARHLRSHPFGPETRMIDCPRCCRDRDTCLKKIPYRTVRLARAAADDLNDREEYRRPVVVYRCPWCVFWHLTKARNREQRKRAEKARRKWLTRQRFEAAS